MGLVGSEILSYFWQCALKVDWDDWKKWEWMQPGWKGIKMHSQYTYVHAYTYTHRYHTCRGPL